MVVTAPEEEVDQVAVPNPFFHFDHDVKSDGGQGEVPALGTGVGPVDGCLGEEGCA